MDRKLVYGIQQVGIGVENADEAFKWYATRLGSDLVIFDDSNEATYMASYMGGKARNKRALLAMNDQGGGGYEIWQYADRKPSAPKHEFHLGDFGINVMTIKSRDAQKSFNRLHSVGEKLLSEVVNEPDGAKAFYMKDPYDNVIKVKEFDSWYANSGYDMGGAISCMIGVSDMEKALVLYKDILAYDELVFDEEGIFDDFVGLTNGDGKFRRVLLKHKADRTGGFSKWFGDSQIELVQCLDRRPNKIFEDRFWGDLGYIHLCFDIKHMSVLVDECAEKGFPFRVLSSESFDMGEANGHWGYLEDADGTLIEFVETNKVPISKKIGLNINLKKRDPHKPLPKWMINSLKWKRVKVK